MDSIHALPTGVPLGGVELSAVVIGASTGGPKLVEAVLRELPYDFPAPVAVCQHMPPGFTRIWAERLDDICRLKVREAVNREEFVRGTVYIAPVGVHMRLRKDGRTAKVALDADFADSLHVPSIDMLMSSAAAAFGSRVLGVLLTGLGSDGAMGMLAIRRAGGHTICETPESAIAASMPQSAVELGAAAEEIPGPQIPRAIVERVRGKLRQ